MSIFDYDGDDILYDDNYSGCRGSERPCPPCHGKPRPNPYRYITGPTGATVIIGLSRKNLVGAYISNISKAPSRSVIFAVVTCIA